MRVLVGGSLRDVPRDAELCKDFVRALGEAIVKKGHVLLNGCRGSLDREIASAANDWLVAHGGRPELSIISYFVPDSEPVHNWGTIRLSGLTDWQMDHPELEVPEQIESADVTIFVAGSQGTFWAKNWAFYARKPILGIPYFGGAGETIYKREKTRLASTYPDAAEDYETLNQFPKDVERYAAAVLGLAERMVTPTNVFPVMSFQRELRDTLSSFKEVCKEFGFVAERTDESASFQHILPRIEAGIRSCAFVITDVSVQSPNVFYELGFAQALGKTVIMTAKKGTELPFDIGDMPVIFWDIQEDLKDKLRKRIEGMKSKYGRQ